MSIRFSKIPDIDITQIISAGFEELDSISISTNQDALPLPSSGIGWRVFPSANLQIRGVQSSVDGTVILLFNDTDSGTLTLKHDNSNAALGNRIYAPHLVDLKLEEIGSAYLRYDSTLGGGSGGWHILEKD